MLATNYQIVGQPNAKTFTPYGGAREFIYCTDPEVIIAGPAETGKTLAACWLIHVLACKYPGAQMAIARKLQKSVYGTVLQTFERVIKGAPVQIYGGERPEKYNYTNGSVVWVGGLDNPDKLLSSERDLIYVNQAEEIPEAAWETMTTRTTGRNAVIPYPRLVADANPGGSQHWILKRSREGKLTLIASRHEDNPTLYDHDTGEWTPQGQRTLARLGNLTGVRRKRLLEGVWATAEGAVYDRFDVSVHVVERNPDEFQRWYLAMDEGYTNPAVILLVGEDGDGRLHVAREFYRRGVLQSVVVETAAAWQNERRVAYAIVDKSAAGLIADLRDVGIPTNGSSGRVLDGITLVQTRLRVAGDGRPRLTVDPGCIEAINEFESYVWKPAKDEPVKENDHAMDAIRYLVKYKDGGGVLFG